MVGLDFDFTDPDRLLPHPVYAWMGRVCVLSLLLGTLEAIPPLIRKSYEYIADKYQKAHPDT